MFNKKLLGASIFALATSFTNFHAHAAPVVASGVLAQVDVIFNGTPSVESSTTPTGTPGRVDVYNYNDNRIDYADGDAISSTTGGTYVVSDIYTASGEGCGMECEESELFFITNDVPPSTNDPIDHVSREVLSLANWSMQIEGDATHDMQFDLGFFIPNSSVLIYGDYPENIEFSSEVHAEIKLDNVVIWSFGYKLSTDGTSAVSFEQTPGMGSVPNITCDLYPNDQYCRTSFFSSVLDLGIISAGSSALLEYEAWAETKAGAYTDSGNCGYYYEETSGCYLEVSAQFGDPASISNNGLTLRSTPIPTISVPEPGIIGLFGLGLAGLFIRRRRT